MKYVGSFLSKVAAYGVALLITTAALSVQAEQGQAKVVAIKGSAQYSEGGAWMPLKVGTVLGAGAIVQTAAESQVDLYLADNGPTVRVAEDSTLGLTKLVCEKTGADVVVETELNLTAGRILGNVKKTSEASRYDVKIPTGTVSIRGTTYDISANGLARCIKGFLVVNFKAPSGVVTTHRVNAGQTFSPETQTVIPTPSDYKPGLLPLAGAGEGGLPPYGQTQSELALPVASPGITVSGEQTDGIVAPNALNPLPNVDGGYEPPVTPIYPIYR